MSSCVARCYTPLKTNIYIKPKDQYDIRRDSFEIDVFQASRYYSAIREGHVATDADRIHQEDVNDYSTRPSINLAAPCKELEKVKSNKHKKLQPGSPGAKLASYLSSLLNQTLASPKPKKNKPVLFEDDKWSSRSSSMSHERFTDVAEATSVHSCPTYYTSYTRPTRKPACTKEAHTKPGNFKDLRSYSRVISKQSLLDAETLVGDGRWPALTWFDKELKMRKGASYCVKGLKKVREEDGGESDSSSDLFELRNHDLRGQGRSEEFPIHRTTNMNNIKDGR